MYRDLDPQAEVQRLKKELADANSDRDKFRRRLRVLTTVILAGIPPALVLRYHAPTRILLLDVLGFAVWGWMVLRHLAAVRLSVALVGVEEPMPTPDRNDTPPIGVPGVTQHMITWDRYQDGRIRVALSLGIVGIILGIVGMFVGLRRIPESSHRAVVCPPVTIPACPPPAAVPACPAIPACPACPTQRSRRESLRH